MLTNNYAFITIKRRLQIMKESKKKVIKPEVVQDGEMPQVAETSLVPVTAGEIKSNFPKLTDADITKHVNKINDMVGDSLYKTSIEVGKYILKEFFNNDIQEAMSKNPNKSASYRKLQGHPDLKIHFNTLNQMVRVAAQEDYLSDNLDGNEIKSLSYSHRIELLKCDDDTKLDIAKKCISENLSIRDLRKQLKGTAGGHQSDHIHPFNPILTNILNNFSQENVTIDNFHKLSLKRIQQIKSHVDEYLNQVETATDKLTHIKESLDAAYEAKKEDEAIPKEKKKRGRPKKSG
jgi:hypothetical protein